MRIALLSLLVPLAACMLDTADLLDRVSLEVEITGATSGAASVQVSVADAAGARVLRTRAVSDDMVVLFTELAPGTARIESRALGADADSLQCRTDEVEIGTERTTAVIRFVESDEASCCAGPVPENSTPACDDGVDNDCDSLFDCDDEDCSGATRECQVGACYGTQICGVGGWGLCTGATPTAEDNVVSCLDSRDNDCDGSTDCDDPDCSCAGCDC